MMRRSLLCPLMGGGGCNSGDESDFICAKKGRTNVSNELDGTNLTPPPQLSESAEERKLCGGTQDISVVLARKNIIDPGLEEDIVKPVFDNAMYKDFQRVDVRENLQSNLDGVDTKDWSQGSAFSNESEEGSENIATSGVETSKRELSISPSTPVGPKDKEMRKKDEGQNAGASPDLRQVNAGADRNILPKTTSRTRCFTVSDASPVPGSTGKKESRSHSLGGTARKKVGAKRKLLPGQSLLPDMFKGLFKPPSVAKYVDGKEKAIKKGDDFDDKI